MNIQEDEAPGEEWDSYELKARLPKTLKQVVHSKKAVKGLTISEQVRLALIAFYDLDPEEHPPVANQTGADRDYGQNGEYTREQNRLEEPRECRHGCGLTSDWRPSILSHERYHCDLRDERSDLDPDWECPKCDWKGFFPNGEKHMRDAHGLVAEGPDGPFREEKT